MKRIYQIQSAMRLPIDVVNPTCIDNGWSRCYAALGFVQKRYRYRDLQFWLVATKAGAEDFDNMSVSEQAELLDELCGKKRRVINPRNKYVAREEEPETPPAEWECECGNTNTGKFCTNCGAEHVVPKPPTEWECECGATNIGKFCGCCGKPRPEDPEDVVADFQDVVTALESRIAGVAASVEEALTDMAKKIGEIPTGELDDIKRRLDDIEKLVMPQPSSPAPDGNKKKK